MENTPNEPDYSLDLSVQDIRLLHYSVQEAIKYWPGAPARPHKEQEHLWYMRDCLNRVLLDYSFHNIDCDRD